MDVGYPPIVLARLLIEKPGHLRTVRNKAIVDHVELEKSAYVVERSANTSLGISETMARGHRTEFCADGAVFSGFEPHGGERSISYEGHTVNALALASEEGRGRLRKAPGSCLANFDPEMSEWGNPLKLASGSSAEFIGG